MLKHAGHSHDPAGVDTTMPGELAVECLACTHLGQNLTESWDPWCFVTQGLFQTRLLTVVWEKEGSIWGTMPKTFCRWKWCATNDGPLSLMLVAFIGLDKKEKKFVNHMHELYISRVLHFVLISVSGLISVVHHVLS